MTGRSGSAAAYVPGRISTGDVAITRRTHHGLIQLYLASASWARKEAICDCSPFTMLSNWLLICVCSATEPFTSASCAR